MISSPSFSPVGLWEIVSTVKLPFYIQRSCPVERALCTNGNLGIQLPFAPENKESNEGAVTQHIRRFLFNHAYYCECLSNFKNAHSFRLALFSFIRFFRHTNQNKTTSINWTRVFYLYSYEELLCGRMTTDGSSLEIHF